MPMARPLWLAGGVTSFVLGAIGIALPVMPTVPFWLLAAFCFSKSHPEWAERLYQHPVYGASMRQWRDRRAIPRRAKYASLGAMAASVPFTYLTAGMPWALIPLGVLATVGPWIWTRAE